ncbi:hypothetical protein DLC20_22765 [Salmonella enterica subsp. enterica serovar Leoben]|nr:hypothetical protein [Salmonella enterica subsp. enterica serovar Newport]EBU8532295.1 hypothetical protein [Salmonella enterica subsp. enterica serovar Leoben]EBS2390876.1 hypothetical protein [Salmonella enterica subsp. enterica serovar Newport]ECA8783145.1 hypothetical protein [Salmonella enterica subsp. enterica serovar Newport]ECD2007317.1 hypothetical protein [Salmonella enterica subsp. enterica serovar Newport]
MILCFCPNIAGQSDTRSDDSRRFLARWIKTTVSPVLIGLVTLMIPTTVAATLEREVVVERQGSNLYITAFPKFLHHEWYGIHPVTVWITAPAGAKFARDACSKIKATYKYGD